MTQPIRLKVILGSTRDGRLGAKVADWAVKQAQQNPAFEVELLDLADFDLPFLHDAAHPSSHHGDYGEETINNWAAKINDGDAYLIITPEYNFGYPGVLKNAIDLLYAEWSGKPVGFVGYSAVSTAAVRAVGQLIPVTMNLKMIPVAPTVQIGSLGEQAGAETLDLTKFEPFMDKTLEAVAHLAGALQRQEVKL